MAGLREIKEFTPIEEVAKLWKVFERSLVAQRELIRIGIVLLTIAIPVLGISRPGSAWTAEERPVTSAVLDFAEDLYSGNRPMTNAIVEVVAEDRWVQMARGESTPEDYAISWEPGQ